MRANFAASHFNSTKVQFGASEGMVFLYEILYFNSTKVQFGGVQKACRATQKPFQFH